MNQKQWNEIEKVIAGKNETLPVGLIVDSPWMPPYCGCTDIDFFARPEVWFECYQKIKKDFPEVTYIPDWWNEFGMATEPSGFGVKLDFYDDNLPVVHHIIEDADDIDIAKALEIPDPKKNGLMPFLLNQQRYAQPRIQDMGEDYYIVSSRGPLTIASHLMPMTELLVAIGSDEDIVPILLKKTTELVKRWLEAQLENVKNAKGILVLDDVCGFLNDDAFEEYALPYFKDIFNTFGDKVHFFHNDTVRTDCFKYMDQMGVDVFNFTHKVDIADARKMLGDRVVMLGNVPPMSLVKHTPEEVKVETTEMISRYVNETGSHHGLIVSCGGGMSMGAKYETTRAMIEATENFPL